MPVCKYFARGTCRKGDNCNFDHVLPDVGYRRGGASIMRRDNSVNYNSGFVENKTHYEDKQNYSYRNNDYNRNYNERNVQVRYPNVNNDYYSDRSGASPFKQYDQRQSQQYQPAQRYSNDKYHYVPRQSRQQQQPPNYPEISVNELYVLVKSEINVVENCRIWPLTCLCIVKLFGGLNDWFDYSPEEIRLAAYIAKANNDIDSYKATLDKIVSKAEAVRHFFRNASKEASGNLKEYLKQTSTSVHCLIENEFDFSRINYSLINLNSTASEFGNAQPTGGFDLSQPVHEDTEMSQSAPRNEIMLGSFQNMSPPLTAFGVNQECKFNTNVFGSIVPEAKPAVNIFGGPPQYPKQPNNNFGAFAQNTTNNSNTFFSPTEQASNNVFGSSNNSQPSNAFSFGGGFPSSFHSVNSMDDSETRDLRKIYPNLNQTDLDIEILSYVWHGDSPFSKKCDVTDEEYEQFKAAKFTIGKVPLVPPPRELC